MKKFSYKSVAVAFTIAGWLWSGSAIADTGRIPMELVDNAIEVQSITLVKGSDGKIGEVVAKACPVCAPVSFLIDKEFTCLLRGEVITPEQAYQVNGSAGTVIFNIKTKLANKVILMSKRGQ